jgi:hypothetical protein
LPSPSPTTKTLRSKLAPTSKKNQFVVTEANIIILPMILSPVTSAVATTRHPAPWTGLGGYGDYVYSFGTNASGGTINAVSGALHRRLYAWNGHPESRPTPWATLLRRR